MSLQDDIIAQQEEAERLRSQQGVSGTGGGVVVQQPVTQPLTQPVQQIQPTVQRTQPQEQNPDPMYRSQQFPNSNPPKGARAAVRRYDDTEKWMPSSDRVVQPDQVPVQDAGQQLETTPQMSPQQEDALQQEYALRNVFDARRHGKQFTNDQLAGMKGVTDTAPSSLLVQNINTRQFNPNRDHAGLEGETDTRPPYINGSPLSFDDQENIRADVNNKWQAYRNSLAEKEKRKDDSRRLQWLAIGDALRHMGNLYYTTKGATPQKYNEPVKEEWARQEADRQKAEAAALAAEQRAYERAKDARDFNYKVGKDATELEKWKGEFGLKAKEDARKDAKNKRDNEMHPFEIDYKKAQTALADAKAAHQKAMSPLEQKKAAAQINKYYSEIAKNKSQTNLNNAKSATEKKKLTEGDITVPSWYKDQNTGRMMYNDQRHWNVTKNGKQKIVTALAKYANDKGWLKKQNGRGGGFQLALPSTLSQEQTEMYKAIMDASSDVTKIDDAFLLVMEHADDEQVQRVIKQYGTEVDSKTGQPVTFRRKN